MTQTPITHRFIPTREDGSPVYCHRHLSQRQRHLLTACVRRLLHFYRVPMAAILDCMVAVLLETRASHDDYYLHQELAVQVGGVADQVQAISQGYEAHDCLPLDGDVCAEDEDCCQ